MRATLPLSVRTLTRGGSVLLWMVPAFAAVNGVAVNGTTGQPQANVTINLVQPGAQGMQSLGQAKTGGDGAFNIDVTIPPGPALLQSTYAGVQYTQAIPPGTPSTGVRVTVFEATAERPADMETQHLILIEPSATSLRISETLLTRNQSRTTFQDPVNGSVQIYLPKDAPADVEVNIDSTGVPIRRPLEKGRQAGEYKVSYPLKPGDTRFDLEYSVPATATFSGRVFSNDPPVRLVTPGSVTLSGDGIRDMGQEPSTGARVYSFTGNTFKVGILGVGSIRTPADDTSNIPQEESGAPKCCEEVPARVHTQLPWVLGLSFGILALGGALLYRRGTA